MLRSSFSSSTFISSVTSASFAFRSFSFLNLIASSRFLISFSSSCLIFLSSMQRSKVDFSLHFKTITISGALLASVRSLSRLVSIDPSGRVVQFPFMTNGFYAWITVCRTLTASTSASKPSPSSSISGSGSGSASSSSGGGSALKPLAKSRALFRLSLSTLVYLRNSVIRSSDSILNLSHNIFIWVETPDPFRPIIMILGGGGGKGSLTPFRNLVGLNSNSFLSSSVANR